MENILDSELVQTPKAKKPFLSWWVMLMFGFPIFVGIIFKIQHWPGAAFLLLVFTALLTGYSIARVIKYPQKQIAKVVLLIVLLMLFLLLCLNYFNLNALITYLVAFFIAFSVSMVRAKKEFQ